MTFWFFILGIPLTAFGALALVRPDIVAQLLVRFPPCAVRRGPLRVRLARNRV